MIIQKSNNGLKFVNIKDGKFSIYQGKDNPPIIADGLEGYITRVAIEQDTYQNDTYDVIIVELNNNGEGAKIKVKLDSGYGRSLAFKLLNTDLSKMVKLQPNMTVMGDKKQTSFFVSQGSINVKQKYTKDNMGNCPEVKETTFKGKKAWDNTEQLVFIKDELLKLKPGASPVNNTPVNEPVTSNVSSSVSDDSDDLPF